MKKLILAITASLCIATLISSCNNLGINAPKMDSDEATQLIVETLEKNINFDEWKIYEIRWMEADELENNLTVLFVEMVNKAGDCFSQTFTLSGPGKGNISDQDEAGGEAVRAGHGFGLRAAGPGQYPASAAAMRLAAARRRTQRLRSGRRQGGALGSRSTQTGSWSELRQGSAAYSSRSRPS